MSDSIQQTKEYETHTLTTQPWTLKKSQTLAKNKAENTCYEISYAKDRDYGKNDTK